MTDPTATNESFEIKRVHMAAAACAAAFMHQLGGIAMPRTPLAWNPQVYNRFLNGDRWRKDNQVIDFHYDHHDSRKSEYVMFSDPVYGPDSDFVEGTPKLLTPVELNVDGLTKIFDNSEGKDPLHIAYEEAVELENRVETSVRNAFTFDVTTTSETTVSGSYAGAELEEKLTEEVHIGEEKETARDEEEDKTVSDSVAIEFDCPAGAIKQVTVTKRHQKELIPVKGVFVLDFSIKMKLRHWWNHSAGGVKYRQHSQDSLECVEREGPLRDDARRRYRLSAVRGLLERRQCLPARSPRGHPASARSGEPLLPPRRRQGAGHREQHRLCGGRPGDGEPRQRRGHRPERRAEPRGLRQGRLME